MARHVRVRDHTCESPVCTVLTFPMDDLSAVTDVFESIKGRMQIGSESTPRSLLQFIRHDMHAQYKEEKYPIGHTISTG